MSIDAILGIGGSRDSGSTSTSSSSEGTDQTQTTGSSGSEAPSGGGSTAVQPTSTSAVSQPEASSDVLPDPPLRANAETVILAQSSAERPAEQEIAYARSLAESYQRQSRQDAILSVLSAPPATAAVDLTGEIVAAREGDPYGDITNPSAKQS